LTAINFPYYKIYAQVDPAKDAANLAKHGISRAGDLEVLARVTDERFAEPAFAPIA
jgi:hypothetical protein